MSRPRTPARRADDEGFAAFLRRARADGEPDLDLPGVCSGCSRWLAINREAFPNVNLDLVQIDTVYPGATPEEVERLVITPIEQELKALNGVDKMTSVAYPGSGRITLELDPYASNRGRIVSDVSLAVDRAELPRDLPNQPTVLEIDGAVFSVVNLAISAPRSALELKRLGDRIRDDLLELPGVARVWIQGDRKAEIRVTVDPKRMARERISVGEIATALAGWNVNAPGGDLKGPDGQKAVRIVGEFRSAEDAADVVLRATERGVGLRLADVASVTESLEEPRVIYDVAGEPALAMIVMKKIDADIIATVDAVFKYIETVPQRYGEDVRVDSYQDFSRFARLRLGVLTNNAMVGVFLVFGTLDPVPAPVGGAHHHLGICRSCSSPACSRCTAYGITLNLISMMGFIIVLGMLVDDAIMVGENITYHMERGMKPREAAVHGTYELIGPVTATVMTTIVAFMPLMFMTGMIGKFVIAIPIVVITLLFLSWLEAFLILPSHVAAFTHPDRHPPERNWLVRFEDGYGRLLESALKHRYLTVLLVVC
jgi:multidrug efflux pump subunit AcrB